MRAVSKCQGTKVLRGFGGPVARREERPFVSLQQLNPGRNVARVANVAVKGEFSSKKCGAQFGNEFFGRIGTLAEAMLKIAVEA